MSSASEKGERERKGAEEDGREQQQKSNTSILDTHVSFPKALGPGVRCIGKEKVRGQPQSENMLHLLYFSLELQKSSASVEYSSSPVF